MSTIFDSVVTKENDHTNLLRNIMERYPKAASVVLSHLLNRNVSKDEAASLQFKTQHPFVGANGREIPDILVEGHNFRCLIEAKIDPALDLTSGQKRGYKACLTGSGERHLCFLVPNDWRHASSVEQVSALLGDTVSVRASHWQELVGKLEEISRSLLKNSRNTRFGYKFGDASGSPDRYKSLLGHSAAMCFSASGHRMHFSTSS
jgi:hypothetical protein